MLQNSPYTYILHGYFTEHALTVPMSTVALDVVFLCFYLSLSQHLTIVYLCAFSILYFKNCLHAWEFKSNQSEKLLQCVECMASISVNLTVSVSAS